MIGNANLIVQHILQIKNGIMISVNMSLKSAIFAKIITIGILSLVFVRIVGNFKSIADDLVFEPDEIISITDSVSTNVTNNSSSNGRSTMSLNVDDKKVRYKTGCYILQTCLLVIILLSIIAFICYHY